MEDSFQGRVKEEAHDLDKKRTKLLSFIGSDVFYRLDTAEQGRLRIQYSVMTLYADILHQRIVAFSATE